MEQVTEQPVAVLPDDEVITEDSAPVEAVALEEVDLEPQIVMLARELDERLAEARRDGSVEAERSARQASDLARAEFDQRLSELSLRLDASLDNQRQLMAGVVELALKIGELLARTELKVSKDAVEQFVQGAVTIAELANSQSYTLSASPAWRSFLENSDFGRLENVSLVFDHSLEVGDLKLIAGEGGHFDLMRDRIDQINSQLRSGLETSAISNVEDALRKVVEAASEGVQSDQGASDVTSSELQANRVDEGDDLSDIEGSSNESDLSPHQSGFVNGDELSDSDPPESIEFKSDLRAPPSMEDESAPVEPSDSDEQIP